MFGNPAAFLQGGRGAAQLAQQQHEEQGASQDDEDQHRHGVTQHQPAGTIAGPFEEGHEAPDVVDHRIGDPIGAGGRDEHESCILDQVLVHHLGDGLGAEKAHRHHQALRAGRVRQGAGVADNGGDTHNGGLAIDQRKIAHGGRSFGPAADEIGHSAGVDQGP